jgi:hypothetical protein
MRITGQSPCLLIECPRCGKYELIIPLAPALIDTWTPSLRDALSCATRQASESDHPLRITASNAMELAQPHENASISDNIDRLLFQIAKLSIRPGVGARTEPGR